MTLTNKSSKYFFFLFLIFISAPVSAQSFETNTKAANTFELCSIISDSRIVFLGETNHGVSEQYSTIAALLEKIFSERKFELLQSESSFFKTYVELIRNGKPSFLSLSMIYKDSKEFSPFMDFTQSKGLLHAGFDPQVIISADDINAIVNQFELSLQQKAVFQVGIEDLNNNIIPHNAFLKLCTDLIEKNKNVALKHQLLMNFVWANEILVNTAHLSANEFKAYHSNYRDIAMAQNFLFWDTYFEQKKTIAIGASAHLSYGFDQIENEELRSFTPMGKAVKESISEADMINIAFSVKNGKSQALNDNAPFIFPFAANALENGHPHYPVLLSTDSLQHHASLVLGEKTAYGNWSGAFDYIVVFENVKPISHRLDKLEYTTYEGIQHATLFILKDKKSGAAIEFAHIYFPEKGDGTTSNDNGLFVIKDPERYAGGEMVISRIGYLPKTIAFPSGYKDTVTVHLTPDVQMLDEVVVSGEVLTPLAIIQKVRTKLATLDYLPQLNYYHVVSDISDGDDSLQNETIVQLMFDEGFDPQNKVGGIDVLTRKELKRALYNKFKDYLSYPFMGVTGTHPALMGLFKHDTKKMSKYFSLQQEQDSTDRFIKILFKSLNMSRKVVGYAQLFAYEGTLWIDKNTYLPIKVDLFLNGKFGGVFYFSTDFDVKNNTLVPVFSQFKHIFLPEEETKRQVILEETSTWLKQEFIKQGNTILHTSHDMTLIKPDQKIWDRFNEFVR